MNDREQDVFLVYRVYGPDEDRPVHVKDGQYHLYGWTTSKKVLKAFLQQRNKNKYIVKETDLEEIAEAYSSNDLKEEKMIDIAEFTSSQSGERIKFFSTQDELDYASNKIRSMFDDISSVTWILENTSTKRDIEFFVHLINSLKPKYADALHYIGYRPKEIEDLFDSADSIYDGDSPRDWFEDPKKDDMYSGADGEYDVSKYIIYSMESVIKVLREDL